MKMRTMRKATLVGGIATGALLFAGSAAQADEPETEQAGLDAVQSAPELLDGLPVPTGAVPGLDAVQSLPVVPGAGDDAQAGDTAEKTVDTGDMADADVEQPAGGLLGGLGGGLPVPLPF